MNLHIFIEGTWDKLFFEKFLDKYLCQEYGFKKIWYTKFAEDTHSRIELRALLEQYNANFLLCPDLDGQYDEVKRIAKIRKLAKEEFRVEFEKIKHKSFVIVQEIESWYLAGFSESFWAAKRIEFDNDTELANKTTFKDIAKQLKKDPMRLRDELITIYNDKFDIEIAKNRNRSFRKFLEKVETQIKRLS